jgi:cardiolipin synthase
VLGAHSVALFTEGDAKYDAVLAAIRAAHHHVHVEYYIFDDDEVGGAILDALAERARAGVAVRILADAVGSHVPRARRQALQAAGAQFRWFNRTALSRLRRRIANFRTHRKIVVVDGTIGFTGGMNCYRAHSARAAGAAARRDAHLRLEGEAVRALQLTFLENWVFSRRERFGPSELADYFPDAPPGGTPVQIVPSGPDQLRPAIYSYYLAAIGKAVNRVWIASPYFVPDESLSNALALAAARGADVRILIPERSDWRLVDAAGASTHDALRRAGVRVLLQGGPLLHAKIALVDDLVGIVGTANIDDRSMKLNFEVIAACYDAGIVAALERQFLAEAASARIKTEFESKAPFLRRLAVAGARLLAPQL